MTGIRKLVLVRLKRMCKIQSKTQTKEFTHLDDLSLILICPAGIVPDSADGSDKIDGIGPVESFT